MQLLRGLSRPPVRLLFSPDGRFLAVGGERGEFHVWDVSDGQNPLWSVGDVWLSHHAAFAVDSGSLVYVDYDGLVRCDALTGAFDSTRLTGMRYSRFVPGGRIVVSASPDYGAGVLQLRGLQPGSGDWVEVWRADRPYNLNNDYIGYRHLLYSADGERFARVYSLAQSRKNFTRTGIEVFSAATGTVVGEWSGALPTHAREGALASTGTAVLIHQRSLYAVDTSAPKSDPVKRLNATLKHFTSAAFSRDGARLATTSNDTAATIWDAATWEVRKRYEWDIGRLRAVCFAPDGLRCAAASDTGQVVVWDLDD